MRCIGGDDGGITPRTVFTDVQRRTSGPDSPAAEMIAFIRQISHQHKARGGAQAQLTLEEAYPTMRAGGGADEADTESGAARSTAQQSQGPGGGGAARSGGGRGGRGGRGGQGGRGGRGGGEADGPISLQGMGRSAQEVPQMPPPGRRDDVGVPVSDRDGDAAQEYRRRLGLVNPCCVAWSGRIRGAGPVPLSALAVGTTGGGVLVVEVACSEQERCVGEPRVATCGLVSAGRVSALTWVDVARASRCAGMAATVSDVWLDSQ